MRSSSRRPLGALAPGRTLLRGRFVILEKLSEGGSGVVYSATDELRRAPVALKVLHAGDDQALDALKREFRSRRDLAFPGLVRLHELFADGSAQFFTMDLVAGVPFVKYVRPVGAPRGYDQSRLTNSFNQLISAVNFLHSRGKIHRDIKSENVLVTTEGQTVLLDFGLMLDETSMAKPGRFIQGTPGYLAPEVIGGKPPSQSSDAYSIGALLYHCLTGWLPRGERGTLLSSSSPVEAPSHLGVSVTPELEQICLRLLDSDPEQRANLAELSRALGGQPLPGHTTTHLIGRESELGLLNAMYQRIADRQVVGSPPAQILWVEGRSGVGKSALLEHFEHDIASKTWTLRGRCHERETVPYQALDEVVDALVSRLQGIPEEELPELLPPAEAVALSRIFSALSRLPLLATMEPEEDPSDPREIRRQANIALGRLLARVSQGTPLLLWIDDVQWGDTDSARLLLDLCRLEAPMRCLFIFSHRPPSDSDGAFCQILAKGALLPANLKGAEHLCLQTLSETEARALAGSLLKNTPDREEKIRIVCQEAAGSPLLIHELARHVDAGDPMSSSSELTLEAVVARRLGHVSALARSVYEAVCIAGAPVSEGVIADITGQADLAGPVTELVSAHLIRERSSIYPDALVPFHDGLREAFVRGVADERRIEAHLSLARAHERLGVREAEAIARHYAAAGNSHRAGRWAELAGDAAANALAFDRAAGLFRMALGATLPGHATVLQVKLATALADAGRANEAAPLFLDAAQTADKKLALEYRRRAAEQWLVSGKVDEGKQVLKQVFREVQLSFPSEGKRALLELLSLRFKQKLWAGRHADSARVPSELELLRIDACRAAWPISFVSTMQAAVIQARFLHLARVAGDPYRLALGLGMEAVQRSIDGGRQRQNAERLRLQALDITEQLNHPHATAFLDFVDGHIGYMGGEWERARAALETAEERLRRRCRSVTWELNSTRFFWGNALYHLGHYQELEGRLTAWLRDANERQDDYARAGFRLMQARLLLHEHGDATAALAGLTRALEEWPLSGLGVHRFMAELLRVQVYLAQGNAQEATLAAHGLRELFLPSVMRRIQLCRIHVCSAVAYAELCLATRSSDRNRKRALRNALTQARALRKEAVPWAMAHATYIAATARVLGDRPGGEGLLLEAASRFDDCRMTSSADAVRVRLAQLSGTFGGWSSSPFRDQKDPLAVVNVLSPGWPESAPRDLRSHD